MINFGFDIHKDSTINLSQANMDIAHEVLANEPSLHKCIQCGSCTATCSAAAFTDYNFRKLHLLMRRGEISELKKAIEKCMLCGKCQLVCPRGVNTRNVILQIKLAITNPN